MSKNQFLTALAWPKSLREEPIIAPSTFVGRLLNALTYSSTAAALENHKQYSRRKKESINELWKKVSKNGKRNNITIAYLNKILVIDSENTAALNRLGIVYAEKREFEKSIECFQRTIKLDQESAIAYHNLGLTYYIMGDYKKAAVALKKALTLESDVAARHVAYAKVQEKLGNDKALFRSLEKAVEIERNVQILFLLLKAYDDRGMKAEAAVIEKELLDMITPFQKLRHSISRQPEPSTLYVDLAFK